ncbi:MULTISPECIES: histidinol-phosphate transaminase [Arthrobacter]|uniref:Histidinol-phosphate aminotransferase n=1 Tax=Arthrobacter caoxuetaonis TaxID=2886935 RepID=A0A9X1SBB0_9MICC|nr:histidinol-phosphate transaminase [Arthrobacter caoxuetaonis]MCC3283978.1 histidinol-phosphate transaminase [Arthrobacter caoxuetaonis]MCC3297028.1 histidinol-phosphate transaminase [Arthrobacter caoxuetaonis]MCC9193915.1 histidinol-phosphate transaminase [Arthrobacter sp. zg-Y916]USQ58402.1 histidinol-phosphate transaminase [Arthrobacter caoxuetaonis]
MTEQLEKLNRLPLRDDLRGLTPYGAPQLDVPILLNVNENTHGLPQEVQDAITASVQRAVSGLNRYPDREFTELRTRLAGYLGHGLGIENIWAGNGSNEVLQQILQAFGGPGRTAMSFPPTYSMYPLLASGTGTRYVTGDRAADFTLSAESAAEQVRAAAPNIVFLCTPNNPTGTALGLDVVEAVYEAGTASDAIVIVDEAYAEFSHAGTPSALELLPGRERLIVSRTMSKAFALAGARLGYLAAAPEVTDALRLVRLPYHLSAVTQATANAALAHADALLANVEDIKVQRDRIVAELTELGLQPAASDANFVFFGGVEDPKRIWQGLLEAGVLIRDVGIPGHLRVTAGTEAETTAFLTRLRELLGA